MSEMKNQYSPKEWEAREQYYKEQLDLIVVPDDPQPVDIKTIESQLDALFTEARIELARTKRQMEKIERLYKLAQKEAYLAVKDQGKTEKDREALAATHVRSNKPDGMNVDLNTAMDIAEHRYMYMDAVVDIIRSKHDRCITDSAVLKLEAGLTPS